MVTCKRLKTAPSTVHGGSTYSYNSTTGDVVVTYSARGRRFLAASRSVRTGADRSHEREPQSRRVPPRIPTTASTGATVVDVFRTHEYRARRFPFWRDGSTRSTTGTLEPLATTGYVITCGDAHHLHRQFRHRNLSHQRAASTISDNRDCDDHGRDADDIHLQCRDRKYATGTGNISVEIVNKALKDWSSMTNER
jgi:hypothetical protein